MAITTAWKWRCKLLIDHTKVAADLTNFPVLFEWNGAQATSNLPQNMLDQNGGQSILSNGEDIRFTTDAAGATEIPFEIVRIHIDDDTTQSYATIFAKVTSVSSTVDTAVYIWWGNSGASAYAVNATYGRNNVWTAFKSVWHLMQTSGSPVDSTGFSNGTYNGALPTTTAGKFGIAQNLNGSTSYFDSGNGASYVPNNSSGYGAVYMSCWKKSAMSVSSEAWFMKGSHRIGVTRDWNGTNFGENSFQSDGGGFGDAIGSVNIANAWSLQAATYDATNKYRHFTNGSVDGSNNTANGIPDFNADTLQGGAAATTNKLNGQLQELRVMYSGAGGTSPINAWFSSDYNSQNSPQTFVTVGSILNPWRKGAFFPFINTLSGL